MEFRIADTFTVNPCGSLRDPTDHAPNGAIIADQAQG
jgi:hypothetical protein